MKNVKSRSGVSFIEILVVVAIFAVLGVLVGRIVLITLRGSNRSESLVKVRGNLDYALAVMERQIRNAETITPCPNSDTTTINYVSAEKVNSSFSCVNVGATGYLASGSARLTSDEVKITACSMVCSPSSGNVPPAVTILLEAADVKASGVESAKVTATTKIFLRTY
jgi:prepilin-type N-terminal cleavage/methylation domain-containing protein